MPFKKHFTQPNLLKKEFLETLFYFSNLSEMTFQSTNSQNLEI